MSTIRRQVVYSGRVQGVGFRATTNHVASKYQVWGYVRNMPDGTVAVVASGEPSEVGLFLSAIESEFSSKIRDRAISEEILDSGEPSGFSIRY